MNRRPAQSLVSAELLGLLPPLAGIDHHVLDERHLKCSTADLCTGLSNDHSCSALAQHTKLVLLCRP